MPSTKKNTWLVGRGLDGRERKTRHAALYVISEKRIWYTAARPLWIARSGCEVGTRLLLDA